jgi:hypothetical protein
MKVLLVAPRGDRRARSDILAPSARGDRRGWQIGPRIRIGGSIGKVGQNIKIAAGKALENPIVDGALTLIPGVGPGLAAAAGASGRVLDTSNGGLHGLSGVGSLAAGAAEGYGAGKVAGLAKTALGSLVQQGAGYFGGGSAAGAASGGASSGDVDPYDDGGNGEGYNDGSSDPSGAGGSGASGGDGLGGLVQGAVNAGKKVFGAAANAVGGGSGLVDKAMLAAAIADAAAQRQKKEALQQQGLKYATDAYTAQQPLREQGLSLLQDTGSHNLSSIFANPANPYSKTVPAPQIGTNVPLTPKPVPAGSSY